MSFIIDISTWPESSWGIDRSEGMVIVCAWRLMLQIEWYRV